MAVVLMGRTLPLTKKESKGGKSVRSFTVSFRFVSLPPLPRARSMADFAIVRTNARQVCSLVRARSEAEGGEEVPLSSIEFFMTDIEERLVGSATSREDRRLGTQFSLFGKLRDGRTIVVHTPFFRPWIYVEADINKDFGTHLDETDPIGDLSMMLNRTVYRTRSELYNVRKWAQKNVDRARSEEVVEQRLSDIFDKEIEGIVVQPTEALTSGEFLLRPIPFLRVFGPNMRDLLSIKRFVFDRDDRPAFCPPGRPSFRPPRLNVWETDGMDAKLRFFSLTKVNPSDWIRIKTSSSAVPLRLVDEASKRFDVDIEIDLSFQDFDQVTFGPVLRSKGMPPAPCPLKLLTWDLEFDNGSGRFEAWDPCSEVRQISISIANTMSGSLVKADPIRTIVLTIDETEYDYESLDDFFGSKDEEEGTKRPALVVHCTSECELLLLFARILNECQADFVSGFNVHGFDWPFVIQRMAMIDNDLNHHADPSSGQVEEFRARQRRTADKSIREPNVEENNRTCLVGDFAKYLSRRREGAGVTYENHIAGSKGRVKVFNPRVLGRLFLDARKSALELKLAKTSLEMVCQELFGDKMNKFKGVSHTRMTQIYHMEDSEERRRLMKDIIKYSAQDSELVVHVVNKIGTVGDALALSVISGTTLDKIERGTMVKTMNSIFLQVFKLGVVVTVTNLGWKSHVKVVQGGRVFPPKPGWKAQPIICLDFKSLYPSEAIAENVCCTLMLSEKRRAEIIREIEASDALKKEFEVVKIHPQDEIEIYTVKCARKGIVPLVIGMYLDARDDVRLEMKKMEDKDSDLYKYMDKYQVRLKTQGNSVYGFYSALTSKLYIPEVSAMITYYGRRDITRSKEKVELEYSKTAFFSPENRLSVVQKLVEMKKKVADKKGIAAAVGDSFDSVEAYGEAVLAQWNSAFDHLEDLEVIYGDTDSIMVQLPVPNSDFGHDLASCLGEWIANDITRMFSKPMEEKYEGTMHPTLQTEKKKYYACMMDEEGKVKMKVRGLRNRKRDTEKITSDVVDRVLEVILYRPSFIETRDQSIARIIPSVCAIVQEFVSLAKSSENDVEKQCELFCAYNRLRTLRGEDDGGDDGASTSSNSDTEDEGGGPKKKTTTSNGTKHSEAARRHNEYVKANPSCGLTLFRVDEEIPWVMCNKNVSGRKDMKKSSANATERSQSVPLILYRSKTVRPLVVDVCFYLDSMLKALSPVLNAIPTLLDRATLIFDVAKAEVARAKRSEAAKHFFDPRPKAMSSSTASVPAALERKRKEPPPPSSFFSLPHPTAPKVAKMIEEVPSSASASGGGCVSVEIAGDDEVAEVIAIPHSRSLGGFSFISSTSSTKSSPPAKTKSPSFADTRTVISSTSTSSSKLLLKKSAFVKDIVQTKESEDGAKRKKGSFLSSRPSVSLAKLL